MRIHNLKKDARLIGQVYTRYLKTIRYKLIFLLFFDLCQGFLDAVGIGILVPLFSFVLKGTVGGQDFISRATAGLFTFIGLELTIWNLLLLVSVIFLAKAAVVFMLGYIEVSIAGQYEMMLKSDLYRDTLAARWPYLITQKLGHLEYIIISAASSHARMLNDTFTIVQTISSFLMYFLVALNISKTISLVALGTGGLVLIVFFPFMKRLRFANRERALLGKHIGHDMNENILGFKVIKAFGVENAATQRMHALFDSLRKTWLRIYISKKAVGNFWQPFMMIFISGVFGIVFTYQGSRFDFGAFIAVMYLIQKIFTHISGVQDSFHNVIGALPDIAMVERLQQEVLANHEPEGGLKPFVFAKSLEFRNVSFSYGVGQPIISNVSLQVKRGEMVGIVGQSGAGKTTVVDLMLRLFEPNAGSLCLDGADASEIGLRTWRSHIGYVSQDVFLRNGTIEDNIRFYSEDVSIRDVIKAAQMANIHEFVESLPKGYQTQIGDRGMQMSGGQRQRVALARVLAKNPPLLILDEATSALDAESESLIQDAIERLRGKVTIVMIAHRLSTLMRCDRLFVLENGQIAEEGTPEELLKREGSYMHKSAHITNVVS